MFVEAAYVQISRDELEFWLDEIGFRGKWYLKENRAGVYVLPLSKHVGVVLSSTIGSRDDAMGKGKASMKLRLESLHNGYTLNRKAMGQNHFKRTNNWKDTWEKGVKRMKRAYVSSQSFYDRLSQIEDREKYKHEWLKKIEAYQGWADNSFLRSLHDKLEGGGILSFKQESALLDVLDEAQDEGQDTEDVQNQEEHRLISPMRKVWKGAQRKGDTWTMEFVKSVADQIGSKRSLSTRQINVLKDKFQTYKVDWPSS